MLEQKTRLLIFSLSHCPNLSLKCFELSWGFVHYEYILIHITGCQALYGSDFSLAYGYSFCFLVFWTHSVQIKIVTGGVMLTGGALFLVFSMDVKRGRKIPYFAIMSKGEFVGQYVVILSNFAAQIFPHGTNG